jgi:hypothetical protein
LEGPPPHLSQDFTSFCQADPGNGFYSVTARFTIAASSVVGVANITAEIAFLPASVPGPIAGAGLPGLILASGGEK